MRFAVIGGGFIGTEIGAALRMAGRDVTMLVPEPGLGARVFPADLSGFLVDYYREKGVQLRMGEGMRGLRPQGGGVAIQTTSGAEFQADVVVAGLGIQPNVQLTEQAGLKVENGIWWTRSCAPASRTFTQRGMSPTSTIPHSMGACGSSTKTMPTRWTCRPGMFHSPPHSGSPDWQPPMQETNQSRSRSAAAWLGIEGTTAFGARPVLTLHPA